MPGQIFVSYSRDDLDYVRRLVQHLAAAGVAVWMDEVLSPGQAGWVRQVEAVIEDCAGLVLVMTPSSAASPWVDREVDLAQELSKPVFPLLLAGRRHMRVRDVQTEDVIDGKMPGDRLLRELLVATGRVGAPALVPTEDAGRSTAVGIVGILGKVTFDGTWLVIVKQGYGPAMKTERRVHIGQVVGVNFKSATAMLHGYIQVVVAGEAPARITRFGTSAGRPPMDDPLSTSFSKARNEVAALLRQSVERAVAHRMAG